MGACRRPAIQGKSAPNAFHWGKLSSTVAVLSGFRRRPCRARPAGRPRRRARRPPLDTVKIVTGFPPGGTSDTLCRRVAENLRGGTYTKTALVENKPGAGGQIAVQAHEGRTDRRQRPAADAGLDADDLSAHLQEPGLRRLHRRHRRDAGLHLRFRLLRRSGRARQREGHPGLPRLVQGQSRQGQLRLAGGGRGAALHRRAAGPGRRHRAEARALSRHAARRPGPGRGPDPGGLGAGRRVHPAGQCRQDPLPRRVGRHAQPLCAQRPDLRRAGLQGPGVLRMVRLLRAGRHAGAGGAAGQRRPAHRAGPEGRDRWPGRDGPGGDVLDARSSSRRC